jgi:putative sterol carrier protein
MSLAMDTRTLSALLHGKLPPAEALRSGRVTLDGDAQARQSTRSGLRAGRGQRHASSVDRQ